MSSLKFYTLYFTGFLLGLAVSFAFIWATLTVCRWFLRS